MKMDEKMFTFGDVEIEKNKFSSYKKSQFSEDTDIDSVLISDKISTGERNYKYFIGYLYNNYKIKPLHKILPIPSAYINNYDEETNWIYFLIKDGDLLNKYTLMLKQNLMAKLYTIKKFWRRKQNLTVMKLQIFTIRKYLK